MPNGGSDCCGTCWFNAKNKGEVGYHHAGDPEPAFCTIRSLPIGNPFFTYCANHPHRRPERDSVPIGPVFTESTRELWKPSPDTEEIRQHLLALLDQIEQQSRSEYPIGPHTDEVVVWQLGEFKESRAVEALRRVASFDLSSAPRRVLAWLAAVARPMSRTSRPRAEARPFPRPGQSLVQLAREALVKIEHGSA